MTGELVSAKTRMLTAGAKTTTSSKRRPPKSRAEMRRTRTDISTGPMFGESFTATPWSSMKFWTPVRFPFGKFTTSAWRTLLEFPPAARTSRSRSSFLWPTWPITTSFFRTRAAFCGITSATRTAEFRASAFLASSTPFTVITSGHFPSLFLSLILIIAK